MMRRREIKKILRVWIFLGLLVAFVLSAGYTWALYKKPLSVKKQIPLYSLNQRADLSYRVRLKPNNLYTVNVLESGKVYMANFIDKIETTFLYKYDGERDGSVSGTYEVVAVVEAYDSTGQSSSKVWEKQFRLVTPTKFSYKGKQGSFSINALVDYNYYNQFLDAVNKAVGTSVGDAVLVVKSNIISNTSTPKGVKHEVLTPSIEIPLGSKLFQIKTNPPVKKSRVVYAAKSSINPQVKKERIIYTAVSAVLLASMVCFGFATKQAVEEPEKKMLAIVDKRYGDRIIQTTENSLPDTDRIVRVVNMENLLKVADELAKPIFQISAGKGGSHFFYVFDGYFRYECIIDPVTFFSGKIIASSQNTVQGNKLTQPNTIKM